MIPTDEQLELMSDIRSLNTEMITAKAHNQERWSERERYLEKIQVIENQCATTNNEYQQMAEEMEEHMADLEASFNVIPEPIAMAAAAAGPAPVLREL